VVKLYCIYSDAMQILSFSALNVVLTFYLVVRQWWFRERCNDVLVAQILRVETVLSLCTITPLDATYSYKTWHDTRHHEKNALRPVKANSAKAKARGLQGQSQGLTLQRIKSRS